MSGVQALKGQLTRHWAAGWSLILSRFSNRHHYYPESESCPSHIDLGLDLEHRMTRDFSPSRPHLWRDGIAGVPHQAWDCNPGDQTWGACMGGKHCPSQLQPVNAQGYFIAECIRGRYKIDSIAISLVRACLISMTETLSVGAMFLVLNVSIKISISLLLLPVRHNIKHIFPRWSAGFCGIKYMYICDHHPIQFHHFLTRHSLYTLTLHVLFPWPMHTSFRSVSQTTISEVMHTCSLSMPLQYSPEWVPGPPSSLHVK